MITRFHVENYKCLRDVTLDLTPIHVLIGPNDSGKTSILEAVSSMSRSVNYPLNDSFQGRWTGLDLVWNRTHELSVVLEMESSGSNPLKYMFSCKFDKTGRNVLTTHEFLPWFPKANQPERFTDQNSYTKVCSLLHQLPQKSSTSLDLARTARQLLWPVRVQRWNARMLAVPVSTKGRERFSLDHSGFGLASCLGNLLEAERKRFYELEARFVAAFPHFQEILPLTEPGFVNPPVFSDSMPQGPQGAMDEGRSLYFRLATTKGRADIPASQASEGALLYLAYLTLLYFPAELQPAVLLVEEPENGVHPKNLEKVIGLLRELIKQQDRTQVILTTHSPDIVDYFDPEEVTLCRKETDGSVSTHRLSNSKKVREQMNIFTLGEIWTGEGDDALAESITADKETPS